MSLTLYCKSHPFLKLGPNDEIRFKNGFADVDPEKLPILKWLADPTIAPYQIENLGQNVEGLVPDDAPDSKVCPECSKRFDVSKGVIGFNSHLRTHRV